MSRGNIEIEVVTGDVLALDLNVLVLKHAQNSFGVDAAAKERLGLDLDMELGPGAHLILAGRPSLGAEKVIILGAPPLHGFGYPEIRLFASRAMSLVGTELPDAREVGLTLHGAGYGLDEIACFDAELVGLQDAFDLGTVSSSLERVVIGEADERRAERLRRYLKEGRGSTDSVGGIAAVAPAEPDHAFVAMPFAEEFEDVFHYGITRSVHAAGLLCERIDKGAFTGDILSRMKDKIRSATVVVADLTDANPNVYLEVGYAWAAEIPTVLVHRRDSELKFDVQGQKCISYGTIKELEESLTEELRELLV
jgi:hypothetical protein